MNNWPMFRRDPQHIGYNNCVMSDHLELLWKYKTGDKIYSSPAVVDGKLYIGSGDKCLYCLDANTGALMWKYRTGNPIYSSPAVIDEKVYVGSGDNIYCLNADTGEVVWKYKTGDWIHSSPAVVDGKLYIGSGGGNIYCFKTTLVPEREKQIKQELEDNKLYLKHLKIMYERGEVREEIYERMKKRYEDKIEVLERELKGGD